MVKLSQSPPCECHNTSFYNTPSRHVLTNGITAVWPVIHQDLLAAYLAETAAPRYFDKDGFISGGITPGSDWDALAERLEDLSPYNPKATSELEMTFK
jgi:hypothetical protein